MFGVYLILSLSALISSACTLHEERGGRKAPANARRGRPLRRSDRCAGGECRLRWRHSGGRSAGITGWWGTPWLVPGWSAILLTTLDVVVAFSGIGVGIAGFIPGPNQAKIISSGLPLLWVYVGGVFWPVELQPGVLQHLARINPMYWALEALRGGFVF